MDKVDIEHVLFWMDAIRNSENRTRTLDAFWKGQIRSKVWLVNNLQPFVNKESTVDIFGGWIGTLASLLFQSDIPISRIRSIDVDPECEVTAYTVNKIEEMQGRFTALTADMCDVSSVADIIINTSCEHITDEQYMKWLRNLSPDSLIVLQSNDYDMPEHVRRVTSIEEFKEQSKIKVYFEAEIQLPLYKRFMIIGRRPVVLED